MEKMRLLFVVTLLSFFCNINFSYAQQFKVISNERHTGSVFTAKYSKDGRIFLSCSRNECILWEVRTGKVLFRYTSEGVIEGANFSTDDRHIIVGDRYLDGVSHIILWESSSSNAIANISQDSLTKDKIHGYMTGLFFTESSRTVIWADNEVISVYNLSSGKYNSYKRINGRNNFFIKLDISNNKVFISYFDKTVGRTSTFIGYSELLSDHLNFRELAFDGFMNNFFYCDFNNALYCSSTKGFLVKTNLDSRKAQTIPLPGYSIAFTLLYQTNIRQKVIACYGRKLLSIDCISNEICNIGPFEDEFYPNSYKYLSPEDTSIYIGLFEDGGLSLSKKQSGNDYSSVVFGSQNNDGDGQVSYFGNGLLYINEEDGGRIPGLFIYLNKLTVSICKGPMVSNTTIPPIGLQGEKKEIVCVYRSKDVFLPKSYFLNIYSCTGQLTDSIVVNKALPRLGPQSWINFYVTPDERQVLITDTAENYLTTVNLETKKTEVVPIPTTVKNGVRNFHHPLLFGPGTDQIIYGGNRIVWFDLKKRRLKKLIDSTKAYSSYIKLVFDHDSTNLIYKDRFWERFNLRSGQIDTLTSLRNVTALTPLKIKNKRLWLIGLVNGALELRDSSFKKVLFTSRPHQAIVSDIFYDPIRNWVLSISDDHHICISDANSLKFVLGFLIKDSNTVFAYNSDNEYYCSAFPIDIFNIVWRGQPYDFSSLDQYKNQPDKIVAAVSSDTAFIKEVKQAYAIRKRRLNLRNDRLDINKLPIFTIPGRDTIQPVNFSGVQFINIEIPDQASVVRTLHVLDNGVPIYGVKGLPLNKKSFVQLKINLSSFKNYIQLYVEDENGNLSLKQDVDLDFEVMPKDYGKHITGRVIFIGIGIASYDNAAMNLPYSVKDIHDVDSTLRSNCKSEYDGHIFLNKAFNQGSLSTIRKIAKTASPEDEIIIFYSGHGVRSTDHEFMFCPYNMDFQNPEKSGILFDDIMSCFEDCKAIKRLCLVDACESGQLFSAEHSKGARQVNELVLKNKSRTAEMNQPALLSFYDSYYGDLFNNYGFQVFDSAYGLEDAYQDKRYNNSIFTYCFLNALREFRQAAKKSVFNFYRLNDLRKYLADKVPKLSNYRQVPATLSYYSKYDWHIMDIVKGFEH